MEAGSQGPAADQSSQTCVVLQGSLTRGEKYTLKSISGLEKWNIISPDGSTKTFPGVCFLIPPPDSDAIGKVDQCVSSSLSPRTGTKRSRSVSLNHQDRKRAGGHQEEESCVGGVSEEPQGPVVQAPASRWPPGPSGAPGDPSSCSIQPDGLLLPPTAPPSASLSPKAAALTQQLDSLDRDLASTEEGMLSRLRSPLSRTDPAADLAARLREQEVAEPFSCGGKGRRPGPATTNAWTLVPHRNPCRPCRPWTSRSRPPRPT